MTPRVHGNTKRIPKSTFTLEEVKEAVAFIQNYAACNGQVLPGRVPGCKNTHGDVKLLPSSDSKSALWQR